MEAKPTKEKFSVSRLERRAHKMKSDYYIEKQVERQIASAVARHIMPRLNESQRDEIVESAKRLLDAQRDHRDKMQDIVKALLH